MLHPDTWSYGDEEAKLFSISVVSQENFRIYWSLWVCSPWDETSPGRWLTPPLLPDSLFHILWISQLVSEFTSLQTWNICDIKHSWLSNRSVINDRTEEVITEDLFWTLNRPVFIILASLKMSLLFIYRSPWWLIDGFVIRVAWKTGTENSEFKFRLRTGLHAHTHTHTLLTNQRSEVISQSLSTAEKRQTSDSNNTAESRTKSPSVTANSCLQTHSWKVIGYSVPRPPKARRGVELHPTAEEQHSTCLIKLLRHVEEPKHADSFSLSDARLSWSISRRSIDY